MAGTLPRLCIEQLAYEVNGTRLLDSVELNVHAGEIVALRGASGSGKSTLLRCINQLNQPTSGRVLLDGSDVASIAAHEVRRRIGMIWQTPHLFDGTIRANFAAAADFAELSAGDRPSDDAQHELLERVGLTLDANVTLDRDVSTLSGGQYQRVSIARALVSRPRVLLCDEPTSALDERAARRVETTLRTICDTERIAMLVVTHDEHQAARLADRSVRIAGGRVEVAS